MMLSMFFYDTLAIWMSSLDKCPFRSFKNQIIWFFAIELCEFLIYTGYVSLSVIWFTNTLHSACLSILRMPLCCKSLLLVWWSPTHTVSFEVFLPSLVFWRIWKGLECSFLSLRNLPYNSQSWAFLCGSLNYWFNVPYSLLPCRDFTYWRFSLGIVCSMNLLGLPIDLSSLLCIYNSYVSASVNSFCIICYQL